IWVKYFDTDSILTSIIEKEIFNKKKKSKLVKNLYQRKENLSIDSLNIINEISNRYDLDQKYRNKNSPHNNHENKDSLWQEQLKIDSANAKWLVQFIDSNGWITNEIV